MFEKKNRRNYRQNIKPLDDYQVTNKRKFILFVKRNLPVNLIAICVIQYKLNNYFPCIANFSTYQRQLQRIYYVQENRFTFHSKTGIKQGIMKNKVCLQQNIGEEGKLIDRNNFIFLHRCMQKYLTFIALTVIFGKKH